MDHELNTYEHCLLHSGVNSHMSVDQCENGWIDPSVTPWSSWNQTHVSVCDPQSAVTHVETQPKTLPHRTEWTTQKTNEKKKLFIHGNNLTGSLKYRSSQTRWRRRWWEVEGRSRPQ